MRPPELHEHPRRIEHRKDLQLVIIAREIGAGGKEIQAGIVTALRNPARLEPAATMESLPHLGAPEPLVAGIEFP